jgi:hypothetical protein
MLNGPESSCDVVAAGLDDNHIKVSYYLQANHTIMLCVELKY